MLFVIISIISSNLWSQNQSIELSKKFKPDSVQEFYHRFQDNGYVLPNEVNPEDALEAFLRAPEGVYVSVGTERGFIGAAYSPRVTHLVLFDRDSRVTYFNLINILLLKMSRDRSDYVYLRQKASLEEVIKRMESFAFSRSEIRMMDYQFSGLRNYTDDCRKKNCLDNLERKDTFKLNYLEDDKAFNHLKTMADKNQITAINANLSNDEFLEELMSQFKKHNLKLSVFDFSNAWWTLYTPPERLQRAFLQFTKVSMPTSLYLFTDNGADRSQYHTRWSYNVYTFAYLQKENNLEAKILSNFNFYHQNRLISFFTGKKQFKLYGTAEKKFSCEKYL